MIACLQSSPLLELVRVDESGSVYFDDMSEPVGSRDAFFRWRVSNPKTLFDSKLIVDAQPLQWDDAQAAGAGGSTTYTAPVVVIRQDVATIGRWTRQTRRRFNYQPGKSQLAIITGTLLHGVTNPVVGQQITDFQRIGLFDDNNGLFFEYRLGGVAGAQFGIVIRNAGVDTFIPEVSAILPCFNGGIVGRISNTNGGIPANAPLPQINLGPDPHPILGATALIAPHCGIDLARPQVFFIDFEWLGVGDVRFGVFVNGKPVILHQIFNCNAITNPYLANPNLPVRYEVQSTHAGVPFGESGAVKCICATVISEGGVDKTGPSRGIDRGDTPMVTLNSNALFPIISVRLKSTALMAHIILETLTMVCTTNSAFRWILLLNPTFVGVAPVFAPLANSPIEFDNTTVNTTTVTGGTILRSGYGQAAEEAINPVLENMDAIGASIAGVSDIIVLAVQRLTAQAETFYASLGWHETI